jgi:hypothetical protein
MNDLLQGHPSVIGRQDVKPGIFEYLRQRIYDERFIVYEQNDWAVRLRIA